METSGGSNGGNRRKLTHQVSSVDPSNLRNLIRSFSNDENGYRDTLAGLTLGAVLRGEEKRLVRVPPVSRTLFECINEESGTKSHHRKNWKSFRDRLRLRRAGAAWASSSGDSEDEDSSLHISEPILTQPISESAQLGNRSNTVTEYDAVTAANEPVMMRLAAALATERELQRQRQVDRESMNSCPLTEEVRQEPAVPEPNQQQQQQQQAESEEAPPVRMSLMALLEETDKESGGLLGSDDLPEDDEEDDGDDDGGEYVCCVCMVRHKGAAFIPCGHTFCRLCSRELWVSRGNCPLCNGYILEILDIF